MEEVLNRLPGLTDRVREGKAGVPGYRKDEYVADCGRISGIQEDIEGLKCIN